MITAINSPWESTELSISNFPIYITATIPIFNIIVVIGLKNKESVFAFNA